MLPSLQQVVQGNLYDNLMDLIVSILHFFGSLTDKHLGKRLVYFGIDGDSNFQGSRYSVIVQLTSRHASYMLGIHCVAH